MDKDKKVAETIIAPPPAKKQTFKGIVVPEEGLTIGTKKPTKYLKGATFVTDNESLYQNLFNAKKIK